MTKTILKSTLIIVAILLTGTNANAAAMNLTAGTKIEMHTGQVGGQIAGLSSDGMFFAVLCGSGKDSADLLFQNTNGDIVMDHYNELFGGKAWSPVHSNYTSLTDAAAKQVCNNPNGKYVFKADGEDGKTQLSVEDFTADTTKRAQPDFGKVNLRTVQFGHKVVAVTADWKFFAIACNMGFLKSSADFIYPNSSGRVVVKDYSRQHVRVNALPEESATYWPMTQAAMAKVCNYPNDLYTLNVNPKGKGAEVDFVTSASTEAKVPVGRGRGF